MWRKERNRQSERTESGRQPIRERESAHEREEEEEVTLPSGVWLLASSGFWLLLAFGFFWLLASGFWHLYSFRLLLHIALEETTTHIRLGVAGRNGAYPTTVDSMRL